MGLYPNLSIRIFISESFFLKLAQINDLFLLHKLGDNKIIREASRH